MKKLILSIVLMMLATFVEAQEPEQGFSFGLKLGTAWNHVVTNSKSSGDENNPVVIPIDTLMFILAPSINLRTEYTEHGVGFDLINKTFQVSTSFRFERAFDIYVRYEKDVTLAQCWGNYGAAGVKKTFAPLGWLEITAYGEFGNDLICTSSVRFGVELHPQYFFNSRFKRCRGCYF
jgi:hypothetical protein